MVKSQCLVLALTILLVSCTPTTSEPDTPIAIMLTSTPESTLVSPTVILPTMFPTEIVAGLTVVTRKVWGAPENEPLHFRTWQGEAFNALTMGQGEDITFHWLNDILGMELDVGNDKYIVQEIYNNDGAGQVLLTLNGKEIYKIDAGHASPISALRGIWAYDNHWVLETNYYTDDTPFHGKISQDGILLNDANGYEEAFNFQIINGRPFYFSKQNGLIDAWFDGQLIPLGYDEIPHYSCCSAAEYNPRMWKNMVAFFGIRGKEWYFVQIGTPDSFR